MQALYWVGDGAVPAVGFVAVSPLGWKMFCKAAFRGDANIRRP